MRIERLIATAGPDGRVRFEIAGTPGRTYEVVVTSAEEPTNDGLGWPPGFFETVIGSIYDDSFVRPPQPASNPLPRRPSVRVSSE